MKKYRFKLAGNDISEIACEVTIEFGTVEEVLQTIVILSEEIQWYLGKETKGMAISLMGQMEEENEPSNC